MAIGLPNGFKRGDLTEICIVSASSEFLARSVRSLDLLELGNVAAWHLHHHLHDGSRRDAPSFMMLMARREIGLQIEDQRSLQDDKVAII